MHVLLIGEIHPDAQMLLEQNTKLTKITNEQFLQTKFFPEIEAVVLRTFTPVKASELQKLPKLKYIISCSVGTDNLDLEEMKQKNIELVHCPGTNANSVAEHTLYLLLSVLREDTKKHFAELKGKTIGIVGLGAVGKIVARKLLGFEAKVIAFDVIEQDPKVLNELKVEMKSFEDVLTLADIVTVHVPLFKQTENLMDGKAFSLMKRGSFFINTSRAEVINENDLITEWNNGHFRGMALDVCSPTLKQRVKPGNVIITDHCAAQGEDSFREQCMKPVEEFLKKIKS